jgi:outer membrane protein OmpA-like peptidoglycan-associated protein
MNWFKQNPIASLLLALTILGVGATSYLAFDASSRRNEAQANLDAQLQKLKQFQNQKPFPTDQSLKELKASVEEYKAEIGKYRAALAAMEEPLVNINPQEFQDELRKAADNLRKKALEKGVVLPENFFYGLDQYQSTPPSQQEVPELNREFRVIQRLTDSLVDLKIDSIGSLVRKETGKKTSPMPAGQPPKPSGATEPSKPPSISSKTFIITFTATQEKFLTAFNLIQDTNDFLFIRSLLVDNTSPNPPLKTQAGDSSSVISGGSLPEATAPSAETIQAILGRESVTTTLEVEILNFPDSESATPAKATTTPSPK